MEHSASSKLFKLAQDVIPGGVNSPVRACKSVGRDPLFIEKAEGGYIWDADGNKYLDFVSSWGPMIMGHAHPKVIKAVQEAAVKGTSYGAPTTSEIDLASMVVEALPSVEKVRFVSSGTEATMSAVRLARGYTGKNVVVKFDGCYHGHADSFLVKAGSGVLTLGIPGSPGVPEDIVKNTISIPYNDFEALEATLRDSDLDIACVIVEPVAGNMGCIAPADGFLQKLRKITKEEGIVLIFDEVITGFRLSYGGAQKYYDVTPDLTCLGKIIGGGLPVGAYGGKADIMNHIAPDGPVYQAGTLSGNPLAMAAGKAALTLLQQDNFYSELNAKSEYLASELTTISKRVGVKTQLNRVCSLMTSFFTNEVVTDFNSAMKSDTEMYAKHYRYMLNNNMYMAPSQFEVTFISAAHTQEDLDLMLNITEKSLSELVK
ncbi:MAG: glutamate-1-semialdehyde 2,1-aminomutase [Desulfotalea sp.]